MTIKKVTIISNTLLKDLKEKKLRVAAYVRVSTKNELQTNSFDSQVNYYHDMIRKRENWTLVNIYKDYGISGKSLNNRDGFIQMIQDCVDNKIDLIYTKSISRFARNAVDCIKYFRLLKVLNVRIIFEEEGLDSSRIESELLLTALASIAQQESENISKHVKTSKYIQAKRGVIDTKQKRYGYDFSKEKNKFIINKSEAKIVRKMFELKLNGFSDNEIANSLNKETKKHWKGTAIEYMLKNRFYIGELENNKFNSKTEKTFIKKNHHVPLIDADTYYKVQELLIKNKSICTRKKNPSTIYNIICGCCGRKIALAYNSNIYRCGAYYNDHGFICDNAIKFEKPLLEKCFRECLLKILSSTNESELNIKNLNKNKTKELIRKKNVEKEELNILDKFIDRKISSNEYYKLLDEKEKKINDIDNKITNIDNQIIYLKEIKPYVMDLYNTIIENSSSLNVFNIDLYNRIIDQLIVGYKSESGYYKKTTFKFIHIINRYDVDFLKGKKYTLLDFNNTYNSHICIKENGKEIRKELKSNRVIFEIIIK